LYYGTLELNFLALGDHQVYQCLWGLSIELVLRGDERAGRGVREKGGGGDGFSSGCLVVGLRQLSYRRGRCLDDVLHDAACPVASPSLSSPKSGSN
jgi:hypothetical protein